MKEAQTFVEHVDQKLIAGTAARMPRWAMPMVVGAIVLFDGVIAFVGLAFAFFVREADPVFSPTAWAWSKDFVPYAGILYFAVPVRILTLWYQRVYRYHGAFSYTQETIKIVKAALLGSLLMIAWTFLFRGGFAFREYSYSRAVFILDFFIVSLLLVLFHILLRFVQTRFRHRGINLVPTLIVGTNTEAVQTTQEISANPTLGYRVVGIIKTGDESYESRQELKVSGGIEDLPRLIRELEIQEVIITDNSVESERLFELMMQIGRRHRVEFRFAPNLFNLLPQKTSVEQIGILPMVRLFREPLTDAERLLKRISDIVISAVSLIVLAPIWIVLSILIKFDSRGPVLFKQERVGMDGRIFLCHKFRTMKVDADDRLHRDAFQKNIEGEEDANAGTEIEPVYGKVKDDPRITRIGKQIRRSSLDELPQLLNVLLGDMSVVGPRPPIPYEVEGYDVWHRRRLDMKPGLTGLWQVSGRNRLRFDEMVRLDLYYIENWTLWLDVKIILLTLPAIVRGDGAR